MNRGTAGKMVGNIAPLSTIVVSSSGIYCTVPGVDPVDEPRYSRQDGGFQRSHILGYIYIV